MKTRIASFFRRPSIVAFAALAAVYAVAMAAIFWGTWSLDFAPIEPDNPTTYPLDYAARWLKGLLAGGDFVPGDLRNLVGSPYFWQELQYAVPCFLAALAMAFYLRGRGLSLLASYGAGAAYGLMGYNVTLFSAGHLGWFVWLTYGPFAFGLIDRAVRKGKWRNWALLGAVLAWGAARQPDLWLLFTLLSFFYGLWCVVFNRRFASPRMWLGVGLAAAVMFVCGWPQLKKAIFTETANRDKQIAGVSGKKPGDAGAAKERTKEDEAKRWDFCTSWSLPPDEAVEFFSASPMGDSSDPRVSPVNRYKGRIGQRVTIPVGQRARDPSSGRIIEGGEVFYMPYRQHSLYFGFLTCLFALLGVFSPVLRRIGGRASRAPLPGGDSAAARGLAALPGGDSAAAKGLAALPGGDSAAAKGLAALPGGDSAAARGLAALPGGDSACYRDVWFWTAAAFVYLLCAFGGFTPFYRLVYALPMGDYIRCPVKFVHLLEFCAAALAGFGVQALLDAAKAKGWAKAAFWALAALALVNVVDLARVDRRFLAVEDVTFVRAPNAAAEVVREAGGGKVFFAVDPSEGRDAVASSFGAHLVPAAEKADAPDVRFVLATQRGLALAPSLGEKLRAGKLKMVGAVAWQKNKGVYMAPQNAAAAALFQVDGVPPPAPEVPPVPDRTAQFFTWLSILGTFFILGWTMFSTLSPPQPSDLNS